MIRRLLDQIDKLERTLVLVTSLSQSEEETGKLPEKIPHPKCTVLDRKKQYPKITNYVVTVRLGVMIELRRLSLAFPNMGRGSKFPSNISKTDGGTNLIFTTGATVTPGCETYYGAKYLAHLMRLMIECVKQPMLLVSHKTGEVIGKINRNLQGLTTFDRFRVVNIVSNGRLTKNYISLAEMEADDERLDWNPEYFPGLEQVLTKEDVPFTQSERASMTIFDSGKGVGMGVRCTEDCYLAYQYVVNKALKYPDRKYVPKNSSNRFLYRQEQKRLFNLESRQKTFDWQKYQEGLGGQGMGPAPTTKSKKNTRKGSGGSKRNKSNQINSSKKRHIKYQGEGSPAKKRKTIPLTDSQNDTLSTSIYSLAEDRDSFKDNPNGDEDLDNTIIHLLFGKSTKGGDRSLMAGGSSTHPLVGEDTNDEDDEFDKFLDQFDVI